MDRNELLNAMRYGSEKDHLLNLRKIRNGPETASTAFCRNLTVISQKNSDINICCWDLDHIVKEDDWKLLEVAEEDYGSEIETLNYVTGHQRYCNRVAQVDRLVANSGSDIHRGTRDTYLK